MHVDRRLSRRTCVIYSESDGNDLLVQNELSLGAPRKRQEVEADRQGRETFCLRDRDSRTIIQPKLQSGFQDTE